MKRLINKVLLFLVIIIGITVPSNQQNLNENNENLNNNNDASTITTRIDNTNNNNQLNNSQILNGLEILPNSTICGYSLINQTSKGGQISNVKDYPWTVLLKYKLLNESMVYGCGGTLISDQYVLTAAHCFNNQIFLKFMYEIRLGEWDLNSENDCSTIENSTICADKPLDCEVEHIIIHPSFRIYPSYKNDIALLRLANKVKFTDYIKPVCLPIDESYRNKNYNGIELNVVGWEMPGRFYLNDKQKIYGTVIGSTNQKCEDITNMRLNNELQMCTRSTNSVTSSILAGNSLLDYDLNNTSKWTMVGFVSFGTVYGPNFEETTVYTRVDAYLPWISSQIRQ